MTHSRSTAIVTDPPPSTPTHTHIHTHIHTHQFSVRRTKTKPAVTEIQKTSQHTDYHYSTSKTDRDLQVTPNIAYNSVQHPESSYELFYEQPL